MSESASTRDAYDLLEVDLRNPLAAGILSWLWPGAGHIYQRRYGKGVLFMVCVLGVFYFGLGLGGGRCVYASWTQEDRRWQYLFQLGVGASALPALVQTQAVRAGAEPPLGPWMAPPDPVIPAQQDQLAKWHRDLHTFFDLGTLFTMVAGLLNVLVICDAMMGPAIPHEDDRGPPAAASAPKVATRRSSKRKAR